MLTSVECVILASAQHGITDEDMLHVHRDPIRVFGPDDLTLLIGASQVSEPVEIGVAAAESIDFIVHAMSARPRFLR
jgi:hypothetical protein